MPHDCRVLWVKLNCVKAQAVDLKQEIDDLVNKRNEQNECDNKAEAEKEKDKDKIGNKSGEKGHM